MRGKQLAGAAVVYRELFDDAGAPHAVRLVAAREGAVVLAELDRPEEVEKLLGEMTALGQSDDERAEGNYLLARHYYDNQNYEPCNRVVGYCGGKEHALAFSCVVCDDGVAGEQA